MLKRALIFVIKPHRPKALPCPALSCLRLPRCKLENLPEFGPRKPTVPVLTKHLNQPSTVLTISHAASPCAAIALLIAVEIHREIWVFRPKAPPSQSVDKNIKSPGRSQHRNGDRAGQFCISENDLRIIYDYQPWVRPYSRKLVIGWSRAAPPRRVASAAVGCDCHSLGHSGTRERS